MPGDCSCTRCRLRNAATRPARGTCGRPARRQGADAENQCACWPHATTCQGAHRYVISPKCCQSSGVPAGDRSCAALLSLGPDTADPATSSLRTPLETLGSQVFERRATAGSSTKVCMSAEAGTPPAVTSYAGTAAGVPEKLARSTSAHAWPRQVERGAARWGVY